MRSTQLIVNLKSIRNNIDELKKYLGTNINIMPIVKSFGYGSHLNSCPEILNEFDYVGVAYLDEAIQLRNNGYKKGNQSNIPNVFAFTMIRNFLNDKGYEEMRREYFIRDLTPNEVNQSMRDIKWLFREYKGLDVITIENKKGDITKFIL